MAHMLYSSALCLLLAAGGPDDDPKPRDAGDLAGYDALVTDEHRRHWAFQPVRRPELPAVRDPAWVKNPVDAFVLAKLEERGWTPSPSAEPSQLLRRIFLDLVGVPPSLDEQRTFLSDPSPGALDRVVDDLLARPAYGERWGRHWLDVVRYAETNGYERDATKPHVWRYRDYVIQAFNDDKPFDRFVLEQLAGDELPDATAETMIATGFHRLGPWDDEPADPKEDRFDQLDDMVRTTSEVFLGLTLGCARCHNHKFEPLTMHDYYRLVAVFNVLERPQNGRTELDEPVGTRAELEAVVARDRQIETLKQAIARLREEFRTGFLASSQSKLPPEAIEAFRLPPDKRTEQQKKLVELHSKQLDEEIAAAISGEVKQQIGEAEQKIRDLQLATPDLPRGYIMRESRAPPATHLLLRGKATRPGPQVEPGVPAVLVRTQLTIPQPAGAATSGRRLALARWIASPENTLTARVIVNRMWQFHFGEGLVRSPSEFGTAGERPTHPELLDWLADWFVREGWSAKKLHRLILCSSTYRMSKRWDAGRGAADPENRLLWRVSYRRLEVEAIRDSMLAVSGQLSTAMHGPSMYPEVPRAALEGHSDPDKIWKPFDEKEASRRTIYAFVKRSMVVPMLEVLDLCDTTRSAAKRPVTTVAPQALALFNGDFVNRQARHFAARLVKEAGDDPERQIERAYLLALCRPPTPAERAAMIEFLDRETDSLVRDAGAAQQSLDPAAARRLALEQMCRVIFNLNEFVYTE